MNNKYIQQFRKDSLEMILLCLIGRKETYGYEIITELNDSASVLGYTKEGTIYPILYRLQEIELIKYRLAPIAADGGSKKYYSLADKGRNILDKLILLWSSYKNRVNGFIESYQQARVPKRKGNIPNRLKRNYLYHAK